MIRSSILKMDRKYVFGLLLLSIMSESLTQELTTTLPVEGTCKGRSCLLGENATAIIPARNFPWGAGIRVGVDDIQYCNTPWRDEGLLKAIIEHSVPFNCTVIPKGSNKIDMFRKDLIDVHATSVWLVRIYNPFLYPHMQADMCVLLKKVEPQRQTIIQAFTGFTWAALLAGVLGFSVVLRLCGNRGVVLEAFRTFISGAFIENRQRSLANVLSLLLSAYGVIMIAAFSGTFMSFLAVSKEPVQPQTLEEVNARVSTVYAALGFKTRKHIFCDDGDDEVFCGEGGLIEKIKGYNDLFDIAFEIASSMQVAAFIAREEYEMIRRWPGWVDKETGRSLTHMTRQCVIAPAYGAFEVHNDWPHTDRLSSLLQNAIEAGLYLKLKSDEKLFRFQAGHLVREVVPSTMPQPLELSIMLEPVVVLGVGSALAVAAFVGELIYQFLCKN